MLMTDLGKEAWNYFVIRCGHCKGSPAALQANPRGDYDAGGDDVRVGKMWMKAGKTIGE
jgi:hypothetical protein